MCGINCIVDWRGEDISDELAAMDEVIAHRGPDDTGRHIHQGKHCTVGLGHLRLAILDLSEKGHQPMGLDAQGRLITDDKSLDKARHILIFNGEVYNFKELRADLERDGSAFESGSDSEAILRGYVAWGPSVVARLRGMFAFLILDLERKRIFGARDYPGIKPLYLRREEGRVTFSSELKRFYALGLKPDPARLAEYRETRHIQAESPFTEVETIPPGAVVSVDLETQEVAVQEGWTFDELLSGRDHRTYSKADEDMMVELLDRLLNEAVEEQMVADVPVGTICSGGIDSSLVTAIAAKYNPDITLFTLDVEEVSEIEYARKVAKHLGRPIVEIPFTKKDFERLLPLACTHADTPLMHPNSVAILKLSQVIRKHGVKVILTGEGGDELFGGYKRYEALLKSLEAGEGVPDDPIFTSDRIGALGASRQDPGFKRLLKACERRDDNILAAVNAVMLWDQRVFLQPLLKRADRMTMAAGIEGRVPLLDQRVVKFASNLPFGLKLNSEGGKYLLKKVAERYLPKEIVWRKKLGMPMPLIQWYDDSAESATMRLFDAWKKATGI